MMMKPSFAHPLEGFGHATGHGDHHLVGFSRVRMASDTEPPAHAVALRQ